VEVDAAKPLATNEIFLVFFCSPATMVQNSLNKRPKVKSMVRQTMDSSSVFLFLGIVSLFGVGMRLYVDPQSWKVPPSGDALLSVNSKAYHGDNFVRDSDFENHRPRFVFVMGLENSGHELLQELAMISPGLKRLQELDIHPSDTQALGNLIYHKESGSKSQMKELTEEANKNQNQHFAKKENGLKLDLKDPVQRATLAQNKDHRRGLGIPNKIKLSQYQPSTARVNYDVPSLWGSPCHKRNAGHNLTVVQQDLIRILQTIEKKAATTMPMTTPPVNILFNIIRSVDGTVLSYPHLTGHCRPLQYPNLDVWYNVCEKAGVLCSHVYIHREDPYQILAMVESRNQDANILRSIQIYTNMLNTMYMQMSLNANRTLGCIDLFDGHQTDSDGPSWKVQVANLMGWTSPNDYADVFEQARNGSLEEERHQNMVMAEHDLVPSTLRSHFDSMARANDMARELCQRIVRQRMPYRH
jgi:hypothetical protein